MRISDWSSDVCSSDLSARRQAAASGGPRCQAMPCRSPARAEDAAPGSRNRCCAQNPKQGSPAPLSCRRSNHMGFFGWRTVGFVEPAREIGHALLPTERLRQPKFARDEAAVGHEIALITGPPVLMLGAHRPSGQELDVLKQRSEEHTSELQSLMRISYAVFCLKKKKITKT